MRKRWRRSNIWPPIRSEARREIQTRQDEWYQAKDPGSAANPPWSATDLDTSLWKTMTLPTYWENAGYPDFDGTFWFRRTVDLPEDWSGSDAELHLGAVDDNDTTWVNGVEVGATIGYNLPRVYRVPAGVLKPRHQCHCGARARYGRQRRPLWR